jgi:hypothetical protein
VEMYGRAATMWPADHEFWPNQLSEVGSLLPPHSQCSHQVLVDLAPNRGQATKMGPVGHLLGPLGRGLVPRGLLGQWTPIATRSLINYPFRSLEKFKIAFKSKTLKSWNLVSR